MPAGVAVIHELHLEMSFSIDLSRAIKKAKGKQELIVKKVMLEVAAMW